MFPSGNRARSVRPRGIYRSIRHTKISIIQTGIFDRMKRAPWSHMPYSKTAGLLMSEKNIEWNEVVLVLSIQHDNYALYICSPVYMIIDYRVVFNWHGCKWYQFSTVPIWSADMSSPYIMNKFFILTDVQLVSKVICLVRKWIYIPLNISTSCRMIQRRDYRQSFPNTSISGINSLAFQESFYHFTAPSWSNL